MKKKAKNAAPVAPTAIYIYIYAVKLYIYIHSSFFRWDIQGKEGESGGWIYWGQMPRIQQFFGGPESSGKEGPFQGITRKQCIECNYTAVREEQSHAFRATSGHQWCMEEAKHPCTTWLTGRQLSLQLLKSLLVACRHLAMVCGGDVVVHPLVPPTAVLSQNLAGRIERILGVQQMVRWLWSDLEDHNLLKLRRLDSLHSFFSKRYSYLGTMNWNFPNAMIARRK